MCKISTIENYKKQVLQKEGNPSASPHGRLGGSIRLKVVWFIKPFNSMIRYFYVHMSIFSHC